MKQPRCGFSDLEAYSFSLQQKIWDHTDLTYRILNYTPDMASTDVRTSIEAAFKTWSEVTPLTFKEVFGTSADITIAFADGSHGGNNYYDCPFNRYSTVLAHAVMLQKNISIHFNEDKTWTKSKEGKNLFLTAIHEIGHALGLSHSNNQNAIMYKFYSPTNVKLHPDDIERIQGIYGSRKDGPHQQSYQSPSGNVLAEWTSTKSCDEKINAVTTYEGKIYFFRENFIMVKDARNKVIAKLRLGEYSPTFFCGVDAAYEENGYLYYTYRNHYWKTLKFAIQGPPRTIEDFGFSKDVTKIDAAVYMEGQGQTLFFGSTTWKAQEFVILPEVGIALECDPTFLQNKKISSPPCGVANP
ncbi:matrix metalloproteinase-18-like [Paroedura picta]|uniref:matrix metalloproteinase-18-like n=1 Tax=Paroedura picta TaxID=143630 RepID=UPI0040560CFD